MDPIKDQLVKDVADLKDQVARLWVSLEFRAALGHTHAPPFAPSPLPSASRPDTARRAKK